MKKKVRVLSDAELLALFEEGEREAKLEHCKECKDTGKRFDATRLSFKEGWLYGDADTLECDGCYWYDTKFFRKTMSADYKSNSEL